MATNSNTYDKIYIGVDQSYANTGISVSGDNRLLLVNSIDLHQFKTHTQRRAALYDVLNTVLTNALRKSNDVTCICERARLHGGPTSFINIDAIKAIGALTSTIVDCCFAHNVDVYSVDTRCWKSQVIGTSKPEINDYGVPPEKWPTVKWCIDEGFEDSILVDVTSTRKVKQTFARGNRKYMYNNDAADSAGISMFGFVGDKSKLILEK